MAHPVSAVMVKHVPYDPIGDFAPVEVSAIPPSSSQCRNPPRDRSQEPDRIHQQVSGQAELFHRGPGSTQHLIAEDLRQRTAMNAQAVSYRTTGEVVGALLRGDAAFAVELFHAIRGQVDSGDLRLLAVATPKRWPAIMSVPTVAESGIPGFGFLGWYGSVLPAGTPRPIIDKMHKSLHEVLVRVKMSASGSRILAQSPICRRRMNSANRLIASDIDAFRAVANAGGLNRIEDTDAARNTEERG